MSRQWHGTVISGAQPTEAGDPATYFRREFTVEAPPRRATLRVTALGTVVPHLNGHRVGDDVLAPGWTSYRHHLDVGSYDVTGLIDVGAQAAVRAVLSTYFPGIPLGAAGSHLAAKPLRAMTDHLPERRTDLERDLQAAIDEVKAGW